MARARACMSLLAAASLAWAAPDEDKLGKSRGYPVGNAGSWFSTESVRVGSFTHQAEIPGLFRAGKPHMLQPSSNVMRLPMAEHAPDYRWDVDQSRGLTVDDFLARQRIMGLLIIKDGVVQVERYQYERKPSERFTSQSMAKSITALAVGYALAEHKIQSLDDRADRYAAELRGTLLGETTIRNLLRMASGIKYSQTYDGTGDSKRFADAISRDGVERAAHLFQTRETEQGTRFYYASVHSAMLAAVVRGATGTSLSEYLTPRLWQPIGAETSALWSVDKTGLELGHMAFNATLRDYGRLGVVLANDGVRPDDPSGREIIPRDFLLDATDWKRQPQPFQPRKATPSYGYGYQFWLYTSQARRFMLLGVYGQSIFVDPALHLVIVQTGANATPEAGDTSLARERDAFWRGVVRYYVTSSPTPSAPPSPR
jgi:CubicO group peptidase (beta-lactamase class C family)